MSQPRMEADSTRAFFRVTWTSAAEVVSLTLVGGNRTGSRPSRRRWYAIGAWLHPARNKASTNCANRFIRMFDFAKAVMRCELTVRCPDERGRLPSKGFAPRFDLDSCDEDWEDRIKLTVLQAGRKRCPPVAGLAGGAAGPGRAER